MKVVIAKICVDNSDWIMGCLYEGLNSMVTSFSSPSSFTVITLDESGTYYEAFLSHSEAEIVRNNATHIAWTSLEPVLMWLQVTIQGFIIYAIGIVSYVIALARFLELAIYTTAAPLPLATFASDGLQEIGKSYLKSYAACVIHAMVIVIILAAYSALNSYFVGETLIGLGGLESFSALIKSFILGGAIMKSEQWSKKICGAM